MAVQYLYLILYSDVMCLLSLCVGQGPTAVLLMVPEDESLSSTGNRRQAVQSVTKYDD
jgi:hypothetical protein